MILMLDLLQHSYNFSTFHFTLLSRPPSEKNNGPVSITLLYGNWYWRCDVNIYAGIVEKAFSEPGIPLAL